MCNDIPQVGCVCNNSQVRDGNILGLPTEGAMVALGQMVSREYSFHLQSGVLVHVQCMSLLSTCSHACTVSGCLGLFTELTLRDHNLIELGTSN